MRCISNNISLSFRCHIILEQENELYRIKKHSLKPQNINKLIDQEKCNQYLDSEHFVCVVMNDNNRIYNFLTHKFKKAMVKNDERY